MNPIQQNIDFIRSLIQNQDIIIEHDRADDVQTALNEIELQSTKNDINTSTPESMEQSIHDLMTINIKYDTDKGIIGIPETASILRDSLLKAVYKLSEPNDEIKVDSEKEMQMMQNFMSWNGLNQL